MSRSKRHIGIDATTWSNDRGFGRFTREFVTALAKRDNGFRYTLVFDQPPTIPVPENVETIVAGAALSGPFVASISQALKDPDTVFPAAMTFVVTASGVSFLGIASAFWGLVLGITLLAAQKLANRR